MDFEQPPRRHIFYHADRYSLLKEGQEIILDENNLSYFGKTYWSVFQSTPFEEMDSTQQREFLLETIKNEPYYFRYPSRLQAIFAANTIAEAIIFANSIVPKSNQDIPIIEIFADKFWTLDSNWLDYEGSLTNPDNYRKYWNGVISNHNPQYGERRPPRLEVMIALPAIAGKIVHVVK
jgi:hypothetical protein